MPPSKEEGPRGPRGVRGKEPFTGKVRLLEPDTLNYGVMVGSAGPVCLKQGSVEEEATAGVSASQAGVQPGSFGVEYGTGGRPLGSKSPIKSATKSHSSTFSDFGTDPELRATSLDAQPPSGRLSPLAVPHALMGLARGVLPVGCPTLEKCQVRDISPHMWALVAEAIWFIVATM